MAAKSYDKETNKLFLKKKFLIHLQMNGKEILLDMEQINRPIWKPTKSIYLNLIFFKIKNQIL